MKTEIFAGPEPRGYSPMRKLAMWYAPSMRFYILIGLAFFAAACAPARENGSLSRLIDRNGEARDLCLKNQAATLDDRTQSVDAIAPRVVAACQATNDQLIQSL